VFIKFYLLLFIYHHYYYFFFIGRDSDLRYLRKTVTDQEQEVAVLDKHIENMKNGIVKLEANTEKLQARCSKYEQHLIKLRPLLLNAFADISFPGKYLKLIKQINFFSTILVFI